MRQGRGGRHKSLCPQTSYPYEQMELNPTMEENLGAYEEHTPQNFATQGRGTRAFKHQLPSVIGWGLLWGSRRRSIPGNSGRLGIWADGLNSQWKPPASVMCSVSWLQLNYNEMVRLERIGWALTATATIGKRQMRHNGKSTRCDPRSSMFEGKTNSIYS